MASVVNKAAELLVLLSILFSTFYLFYHYALLNIKKAEGSCRLLMDLAANEKAVHADFFNDFDDLYDDDDLQ